MRPKLHNLDASGAADGNVATFDAALGEWVPVAPPAAPAAPVEPLTTEIGGVPDLVWDDNNKLVMTEVMT